MNAETFLDGRVTLHCGDCLDVLDTLPADSIDACVTDPPYHLTSIVKRFGGEGAAEAQFGSDGAFARASRGFMGKQWDGGDIAFRPETWAKVLRVLKPGGHVLAFSASRTMGHLQVAIEGAGFEVRDCLIDIIDLDTRVAGFVGSLSDAQRAAFFHCVEESQFGGLLAWVYGSGFPKSHRVAFDYEKRLCEAREGKFYYRDDGALMRREPPFRHRLANAWAGAGTALKPAFEPIVMARKPLADDMNVAENVEAFGTGSLNIDAARIGTDGGSIFGGKREGANDASVNAYGDGLNAKISIRPEGLGRWPSNIIIDRSAVVVAAFPADGDDTAARFFYSAKADAHDRVGSNHPTVKPVDVIQYFIRMVTVPGQTVLDLFAGTGTTGEAAFREGRNAILIEREPEYQADIRRRMALALAGPDERARESIKAKTQGQALDALPLFGG